MKRFFVSLLFCLFSLPIHAGVNARVSRVVDSRTLQLENGTIVTLRGVAVSADDEPAAADYLRNTIGTGTVYVDNGDVYRSPDALFLNEQLRNRAWEAAHGERWLGIADPAGKGYRDATPHAPAPRRTVPQRHHYPRVVVRVPKTK
jgi:hypothetical protein